jgi:hypothetical protein
MAGLELVAPGSTVLHSGLQSVSTAMSRSVSEAPGQKVPVPKTMPMRPDVPWNCPTAGEDWTTWSGLYSQFRLPFPVSTRRCPPLA